MVHVLVIRLVYMYFVLPHFITISTAGDVKLHVMNEGFRTTRNPVKGRDYCEMENRTCADEMINKLTNAFNRSVRNEVSSHNSISYSPKFKINLPIQIEPACIIDNSKYDSKDANNSEVLPVIKLLQHISTKYLNYCVTVVLYDRYYENNEKWILEYFMRHYPSPHMHGVIDNIIAPRFLSSGEGKCRSYVFLLEDVLTFGKSISWHGEDKIVIVTRSSRQKIRTFLTHPVSRGVLNLLVVANRKNESLRQKYPDINLYTHRLFVDSLGSSEAHILTAWRCTNLTRPHIPLFPAKMFGGFNGHQFRVALGHQPPFVFPRKPRQPTAACDSKTLTVWDGKEVRFLQLLASVLNFTITFKETHITGIGREVASAVVEELLAGRADIAMAGIYSTPERLLAVAMATPHSQDCAAFISLASTALPRYRAIMGPFHWGVWLALTLTYLLAMFPLAFSHRHTLSYLLTNPWEIENMFWHVFGTFTNCFTFTGSSSWSSANKNATKMLIGWYWVFSIIITACYTGSIIAFVTLPVFPGVVDTSQQILKQNYKVGTLDGGGWECWFNNSADPVVTELFKKMEYIPNVVDGLHNVTSAYYYPYAFLGSRALLDYIVQANYTPSSENKRPLFHLGAECFVPFHVALAFPLHATYAYPMNRVSLRAFQSGMFTKIVQDVQWEIHRIGSGKLLQAATGSSLKAMRSEKRKLSLDDIQGTFLLLGAGFAIGFFALFIECIAWVCKSKWCRCTRKHVHTSSHSIAVGEEEELNYHINVSVGKEYYNH